MVCPERAPDSQVGSTVNPFESGSNPDPKPDIYVRCGIRWWPVLPGIPLVIVDEVEELPDREELLAGLRLAEGLEEGPHLTPHHQVQVEHLRAV